MGSLRKISVNLPHPRTPLPGKILGLPEARGRVARCRDTRATINGRQKLSMLLVRTAVP